jgi:hypothetical protein
MQSTFCAHQATPMANLWEGSQMNFARFTAVALAASLAATPVLAQSSVATGSAVSDASAPARNPVLADNGKVRTSKVIGASVYNDKDQKLGTIDDILVGDDHKADQAVISIGGVLGVGGKLVSIPYDQLKFPEKLGNDTARVMLPGKDENALNGMPTFHYASNG